MQTSVSSQTTSPSRIKPKRVTVWRSHIVSTPGTRGGKPRIVGRRITVADVAMWYLRQNQSVEEIVQTYNLTHAQVHAALTYYYDHRAEIDQREAEELAEVEQLKQKFPSKLQAKLAQRG